MQSNHSTVFMSKRIDSKQIEEINLNRGAEMAKTLIAMHSIPVLVGAVQPATNKLIIFGFSNPSKEALREMLLDFLRDLDDASYVMPGRSS